MKTLKEYIDASLSEGKYYFTKKEVKSLLGISAGQFKFQAYRLSKKKSIQSIACGFFIIVPAEYKGIGTLPPHWFIDPLMQYLKQGYYIGLLSAAALYGSTHQQPMSFQVISTKKRRNIRLAKSFIEFHSYKNTHLALKTQIASDAGYAQISTKEQTLLDLIRFYPSCGYLSNVATVIKDLAGECEIKAFKQVIANEKTFPVLQRLGFILESAGFNDLAFAVKNYLHQKKTRASYLRPDFHMKEGVYNKEWKLIINDSIEFEI